MPSRIFFGRQLPGDQSVLLPTIAATSTLSVPTVAYAISVPAVASTVTLWGGTAANDPPFVEDIGLSWVVTVTTGTVASTATLTAPAIAPVTLPTAVVGGGSAWQPQPTRRPSIVIVGHLVAPPARVHGRGHVVDVLADDEEILTLMLLGAFD